MKNEVHFPVQSIRSALSKINNNNTAFNKKEVLRSQDDSGEDEGDMLLIPHNTKDNHYQRLNDAEDTDSDVSEGVFNADQEYTNRFNDILKITDTAGKDVRTEETKPKVPTNPKFTLNNSLRGKLKKEEDDEEEYEDDEMSSLTQPHPSECLSPKQVILYQSVVDGTIAVKADVEYDDYDEMGSTKESYSDNEILNGVSFKMRYLGSTPISAVKHQVDDIRGQQAQEAINTICEGGDCRPSNQVILTVSVSKLLVYDGKMQQILMDHPIKFVSYVGDVGKYVVLMVRYQNPLQKQVFRVTCHVFESHHGQQVRIAVNKAFTMCYNDVLRRTGQNEETLLQCAYSEVLGCQKRADEDVADLLDDTKHVTVQVIKRPQEGLGLSLIPSGPGSIIPTIIISSIRPSSPAYKTEKLNVGDQILEMNKRSLCGLTYEEILNFIKSVLPTTRIEFKVVPGSPVLVVELIRPDLKYPLGFSVKDGHITTMIRGSIGERAGVRIGHRIIAINGESTVTSDHDTIAGILLSETGRLILKTMPTQIFNLMLGHDSPIYL